MGSIDQFSLQGRTDLVTEASAGLGCPVRHGPGGGRSQHGSGSPKRRQAFEASLHSRYGLTLART